ncbi:MAG TPA: hypothetical protein VM914_01810 [Pyrinomonadaceae bacterium]|jgi:hypothetical protein|nr:hypothetical protein [Pyrinomonadaceae bacterium]
MKRRSLAIVMSILVSLAAHTASAAATNDGDTDARMVDAKVVEVNDRHISVLARSGVEHVIATDTADTHVVRKGKRVKFKEVKVGDLVTVELDASKDVKFARHIVIGQQPPTDVASAQR